MSKPDDGTVEAGPDALINALMKLETELIKEENTTHYKELQDNVNQAVDLLDYYRQMLYDELNMYHSAMSTKLNDIMSMLTIFSVMKTCPSCIGNTAILLFGA